MTTGLLEFTGTTNEYGDLKDVFVKLKFDADNQKVDVSVYAGLDWFSEVENRIGDLQEYKEGWDSYDAKPIDSSIISKTLQLLQSITKPNVQMPYVVPVTNGSIDIEWEFNNRLLSIKVRSEEIRSFYVDRDTNERKKNKIIQNIEINAILNEYLPLVYG